MSNEFTQRMGALKKQMVELEGKLLAQHGSEIFTPPVDYEPSCMGTVEIILGNFVLLFENEESVESCRGESINEMHPEILKITPREPQ